jgi:lipopolysaccharide export system permease protein
MGTIGWYAFRLGSGAFVVILFTLTTIIWLTQSLRSLDLITNAGQSILVFIGITSLIIPQLILIIGPVSLMIAIVYVLNKMAIDSEIIIISAAGSSPWLLFRGLAILAIVVSIFVAAIGAYISPKCTRLLRQWATEVRTDLVTNVVQPGNFTNIERGLTFHIRERLPNGLLLGIFIDDLRDPNERVTLLAEQGTITKYDSGTFLVLQKGSVQRHPIDKTDPMIVGFEQYAFDLSHVGGAPQEIKYSLQEQYLWNLISPDKMDPLFIKQRGAYEAELHDRLTAPIYPLAFLVIVYAYLGAPRTTRKSRGLALVSAVLVAVALRAIGFFSLVLGPSHPIALAIQYVALAITFVLGFLGIRRAGVVEAPIAMTIGLAKIRERLWRMIVVSRVFRILRLS